MNKTFGIWHLNKVSTGFYTSIIEELGGDQIKEDTKQVYINAIKKVTSKKIKGLITYLDA